VRAKALVSVERVVQTFPLEREARDPSSSKAESCSCRQVMVGEEELGLDCGLCLRGLYNL